MHFNLIEELKPKGCKSSYENYASLTDNIVLVVVHSAVFESVYDEVWDEVRVRCFDFYLDSDIPWALDRVLKSYEY